MSKDTIYREDAIKAVKNVSENYTKEGDREWHPHVDFIIQALVEVPSIPSEDRPQGEWIESFKSVEVKRGAYLGTKFVHDGWSCSECSEVVEKRYPNCPYCLARMKGADDD